MPVFSFQTKWAISIRSELAQWNAAATMKTKTLKKHLGEAFVMSLKCYKELKLNCCFLA